MDNLQYEYTVYIDFYIFIGFKPYYKWITFNTDKDKLVKKLKSSFKPYYKWITFNTERDNITGSMTIVSFKPYYKWITFNTRS